MLDILLQSPVPTALAIVGLAWLCAEVATLRRRQAIVPVFLKVRIEQKHRASR